MSRIIEKKILKPFADAVLSGEKTFEIRKNDEGYQKGDVIRFKVMESEYFSDGSHKLNGKEYEITYVLSGWGLQDGYVVLGIKPCEEIADFPTADVVEHKRGEWIQRVNDPSLWSCSICEAVIYSEHEEDRLKFHKWCGCCGADMRGSTE